MKKKKKKGDDPKEKENLSHVWLQSVVTSLLPETLLEKVAGNLFWGLELNWEGKLLWGGEGSDLFSNLLGSYD